MRDVVSVEDVIENKGLDLTKTAFYAAILGECPSKGARSPLLWNAAFKQSNVDAFMHPMDILSANLEKAVEMLRSDRRFIGGAITMPYKIDIIPFLDVVESEAQKIGAVNCLYRRGDQIVGTNTDGAGALWSLEQAYGDIDGKTVLILGTGGAGLAVATYVATALGQKGVLKVANRSSDSREQVVAALKDFCQTENIVHWPITEKDMQGVDVLINATSMGFDKPESIALNPVGTEGASILKDKPFVFDIIYQPLETKLLAMAKAQGCDILNGLPMNLEQAVIAFVKATQSVNLFDGSQDQIRTIMKQA